MMYLPETVEKRRELMRELIEVNVGGEFRPFVLMVEDAVPVEFYSAPASSTGAHHQPFLCGDGGLFMHAVAVAHMARELCRLFEVDDPADIQLLYAAGLLHDGWKMSDGTRWTGHTTPKHGELAGDVISALAAQRLPMGRARRMGTRLAALVRDHMVQWAFVPRHFPAQDRLVQVLACADYTVSRAEVYPMVKAPE